MPLLNTPTTELEIYQAKGAGLEGDEALRHPNGLGI